MYMYNIYLFYINNIVHNVLGYYFFLEFIFICNNFLSCVYKCEEMYLGIYLFFFCLFVVGECRGKGNYCKDIF